jgi:hypothetical protein
MQEPRAVASGYSTQCCIRPNAPFLVDHSIRSLPLRFCIGDAPDQQQQQTGSLLILPVAPKVESTNDGGKSCSLCLDYLHSTVYYPTLGVRMDKTLQEATQWDGMATI